MEHDTKTMDNLINYLHSKTSFYASVKPNDDALRKENVAMMLSMLSEDVDVSEFDPHNFGIGNTMEFLGVWERVHNPDFNYGEFATIRNVKLAKTTT